EDHTSPLRSGAVTFVSFNIIGFIPPLAYVLAYFIPVISGKTFELSVVLTSIALFIVGSVKAQVVDTKWYVAGAETFLVGGAAAVIAYIVGYLLKGLA
ncbi:MAG: VIT1/CCC1 transporter family protein, partial [Candidatus Dadabacteria bacterium]|nr:VIT1/CCC1 transporter family protein [Candidatus Dadabacteria bacterium]